MAFIYSRIVPCWPSLFQISFASSSRRRCRPLNECAKRRVMLAASATTVAFQMKPSMVRIASARSLHGKGCGVGEPRLSLAPSPPPDSPWPLSLCPPGQPHRQAVGWPPSGLPQAPFGSPLGPLASLVKSDAEQGVGGV